MFKNKLPLLVLFLCLVLALPAYSAVKIATVGNYNTDGNYDIEVDSDHYISFNGGVKAKYELATTNDTITAVESGKTFIVEGVQATSATTTFNLPDADVGLEFTFVVGGGVSCTSALCPDLIINPQDTDYIYLVNSAAASTMSAGDSVSATSGFTGDSIHLICGENLYWQVVDKLGTWADSN